jgi:hypothetical protein
MQVVNFLPKLQKRMHFSSLVAVRTLGRFLRELKDCAFKDDGLVLGYGPDLCPVF